MSSDEMSHAEALRRAWATTELAQHVLDTQGDLDRARVLALLARGYTHIAEQLPYDPAAFEPAPRVRDEQVPVPVPRPLERPAPLNVMGPNELREHEAAQAALRGNLVPDPRDTAVLDVGAVWSTAAEQQGDEPFPCPSCGQRVVFRGGAYVHPDGTNRCVAR